MLYSYTWICPKSHPLASYAPRNIGGYVIQTVSCCACWCADLAPGLLPIGPNLIGTGMGTNPCWQTDSTALEGYRTD